MQRIKRYDFISVFLAAAAILMGMLFIYSATRKFGDDQLGFLLKQGGAVVLGIAAMYLITCVDYEDLASLWPFIVGASVFILVLVLFIGTGDSVGTRGWIRLAGVNIQPAEVVKVCFIITLSKHLYHIGDDINYIKNVALLTLHLAVPIGLVLLQPDVGTALVYAFIFLVMVFMAGIDWKYIAVAAGGIAVFSVVAWFFLLSPYQLDRFYVFLNPESDPLGAGYHAVQSKMAVGSGQITGKGLFQGIQTQLDKLPESQTDFIFGVIGEEAGLVGCILVVVILMALILRCLVIARNARIAMGSYMCIGVAAMWLFHTFENIGMTIGIMPITGIPLPFVSYGGSSVLTNLMALGLVLNVRMRKKTINF